MSLCMGLTQTSAMKLLPTAALCGLLAAFVPASAGTLKIDKERSRIQVDARATGHSFTGTLGDYEASIAGDASSLLPSSVSLAWKFADLKTGDAKRDGEMIKWLGGGKPEGSFKFTKTWSEGGKTFAMGDLRIHGVSKTIAFPFVAKRDGDWITVDGAAAMNYQDFGLPVITSMAVMKVNPGLTVRFHLVGRQK